MNIKFTSIGLLAYSMAVFIFGGIFGFLIAHFK